MDKKEKYFQALKAHNGHLDEIELGESLNIDEESTRKIISLLLSEHKIEYVVNGACNYRIKKTK
jgi:transcription initiation factor IIE alpha subunit